MFHVLAKFGYMKATLGGAVIEEILPADVASAEAFDDVTEPDLFPEERVHIANAVGARRHEFGTARRCARLAMAKLGLPPRPLPPGERRAPQWPVNVVGSITHCANYRAAAVAATITTDSLGIDAEPNEPLCDGVVELIAVGGELAKLTELTASWSGVHWDRLLFSCKESVYKAWFPLTRKWLGFDQAVVSIDPARSAFTAMVLVPGPVIRGRRLSRFSGRWLARDGLLLTAIAVQSPTDELPSMSGART